MKQKYNLYKHSNVFQCVHDIHHEFKSRMSPFHILNEKKCYPNGCIYFTWKCKLLAKKKKCFRNFSHVGQECFNCRYFYEEKVHQYPEILPNQTKSFLEDYTEFEEWVQELKQDRITCEGKVSSVRPDIKVFVDNGRSRLSLRGFLVRFEEGFLNNVFFADSFYLSISPITQNQLRFRRGDTVEFQANLTLDRGRFRFIKSGKFSFFERGRGHVINRSEALSQLTTCTLQEGQPLKCKQCQHGYLVDIETTKNGPRRTIVCADGQDDYQQCTGFQKTDNMLVTDSCAALSCKHTI